MITYKNIITSAQGMRKIASLDLKIKQAIELSKLIKKLDEESQYYYEQREKILQKYGEYEEEKDSYRIAQENRETAMNKLKELDELSVEIGERLKISVSCDMKLDTATVIMTEELVEFVFEEE